MLKSDDYHFAFGAVPFRVAINAPRLVTRRSTDLVAVANLQVARVRRYIHDHYASRLLGVDAVVAATDLSRPSHLCRTFRKLIGRRPKTCRRQQVAGRPSPASPRKRKRAKSR